MMTLPAIREQLQDRRLDKVAQHTGLHYNTLRKIRDDDTANPTYYVLVALSNYLEARSNDKPA